MAEVKEIICAYCNAHKAIRLAEFKRHDHPGRNWFCSREHARKFRSEQHVVTKACLVCGSSFTSRLSDNRSFCSKSCSNLNRFSSQEARDAHSAKTRKHAVIFCLNCGKSLRSGQRSCCSVRCRTAYHWACVFAEIDKTGSYPTTTHGETDRRVVRRYITTRTGAICSVCGAVDCRLVVDHIDGDALNSAVANLRLLCDRCDASTDTYKNKPHKATRVWRRSSAVDPCTASSQ